MEVFFSGRVQGVGFRYTALQVSRSFAVVGTVQNLSDGRVKMVLEGDLGTLERFIAEVCESIHGSVSDVEKVNQVPSGEFSRFDIIR